MPLCWRTGALHRPALGGRPLDAHLGQRRDRALGVRRVLEHHVQPLAADLGLELVRGALGDHLAVVDHHDLVGEPVGLVEVLRREQHGRALPHAALDRLPQREPAARVQAGRRLVEEQHRRAVDQRGGEVEPPAHAARVRLGRPLRGVRQVEALEQLVRAGARVLAGHVVELPDHLQVLEPGQVLVDRRVLAREPDLRAQRRRVALHVQARDARAAGVGLQQRREDPHRRRLARAVRARAGRARCPSAPRSSTPRARCTEP